MEVKLLSEEVLCRGRRVTLISREYLMKGRVVRRDIVHFGQAVAIVPLLSSREILLLRQFRAPVGKWVYEVPAGMMEEGEDVATAAKRELIEETGYEAESIERLVSVYTAPGYSDEVLHIVVAKNLKYVGARPEPGELIEVIKLSLEEALRKVFAQEIADAKTVIALTLLKLMTSVVK
ncbi:MAG: NUDIX hydrolase [Desulfurococcales archaeon]|nr:NUDIX hydrolase [Desulfurococcales archaeon]